MSDPNNYDFSAIQDFDEEEPKGKKTYEEISLEDVSDIKSSEESSEINLEKINVRKKLSILKALVICSILYGSTTLYDLYNDVTVMTFAAPAVHDTNVPQRLSRIENISKDEMEHYLKDFVRQYIRARYPKNDIEAKFMYEFIRDHSSGEIKSDFNSRIENLIKVSDALNSGKITSIYPKNSMNIQIRKSDSNSSEWKVLLPVRKVKRVGLNGDERTDPNIEMTIEVQEPTQKNIGFG